MPNPTEIRARANKSYEKAKALLEKIEESAIKKAIKKFHKALDLICGQLKNHEKEDYRLLYLCNQGLASAYQRVTTGVNQGDIEYRQQEAARYLEAMNNSQNRARAKKSYEKAKEQLEKMDEPAIKKGIKKLHKALDFILNLKEPGPEDYRLAYLCNQGLASAYQRVTTGVNQGDIEYRLQEAERYLKAMNSPLINLSFLNQSANSSQREEKDYSNDYQNYRS